ncbi:hypothetical protein ACPV3A_16570 [Paenibacillus sp. Dod16]
MENMKDTELITIIMNLAEKENTRVSAAREFARRLATDNRGIAK